MSAGRLPFRNLLTLVPEVEVLEGLRFALARHALTDPSHQWSDVADTGTVDVRVLDRGAVMAAVAEAAAQARQEIEAIYTAVGEAMAAALEGSPADAAERLIAAGAEREENGRYTAALRFFRAAYEAALPIGDRHAEIVALRRMGRLLIASGEVTQAESCYRRSADLAHDLGEVREEVIALTGLGNVYLRTGQSVAAEAAYRQALALVDSSQDNLVKERAQLMNNLAQIAVKLGRLDEAHDWVQHAGELWQRVHSPTDFAVYNAASAHVAWAEGDLPRARDSYQRALDHDPPDLLRAAYAIDLANVYLEMGDVTAARQYGREAEQAALSAGSVGYLTEVYRGLGNIARDSGGEPVALYEKSLEIARKNGLRLSEAETLIDYARLQRATGNAEEGRAFLEYAVELLDDLGAAADARRAREELERTPAIGDPVPITD